MELVPKIRTQAMGLPELAMAVGLKQIVMEPALTRVVGDGTFLSAVTKVGLAFVIPQGKIMSVVRNGLLIDGVEDGITALFGGFGGASQSQGVASI